MESLNNQQIIEQIIDQYNKGATIVFFTSGGTVLLKLKYNSSNMLNEILNTGLYRHNPVLHGRIIHGNV